MIEKAANIKLYGKSKWLRTDEHVEFIEALEFTARVSTEVHKNPKQWRWLIFAMHLALQGVFVCTLRCIDTTGLSVLQKDNAKKMWHWLDVESRLPNHNPPPEEHLASMMELFRRLRDPSIYQQKQIIAPSQQAKADVKALDDLRKKLAHFVPSSWSLDIRGLPRITLRCCEVIEQLAIINCAFSYKLNGNQKRRISDAVRLVRSNLHAS
jgi:hypothetical protein